ncbi:Carboxylesterase family-domain-containing protein [Mycena crocata]|nr:Carboxylesterase family-domain-containing protein [Mycena crocata]
MLDFARSMDSSQIQGYSFNCVPSCAFTPATPVSKAEGLQSAAVFGDDCPQFPELLGTAGIAAGPPLRGANQSEDCLYANVWRSAGNSTQAKLPILVYIYDGGYFAGTGSKWNETIRRSVATKKPVIYSIWLSSTTQTQNILNIYGREPSVRLVDSVAGDGATS